MKACDNIRCRQLILLLLLTFLLSASADAVENLLINPGFEEGILGWNDRGCTLSTSTVSRSGSYSGYATNRNSYWHGIKQSVLGKMIPGETYTISGWMKLENSSSDQIIVTIERRDDRGVSYIRVDQSTGYNNRWTRLSGRFTLDVVGILTTKLPALCILVLFIRSLKGLAPPVLGIRVGCLPIPKKMKSMMFCLDSWASIYTG